MSELSAYDRALLGGVFALACPNLFGGVLVRAPQGPLLELWKEELLDLAPDAQAPVIMPASISADRLVRSLSVARSLAEGRPIYQTGLLEDARGRVLIVNGMERLAPGIASALASALDQASRKQGAPITFFGIDESSAESGPAISAALLERLAFRADLNGLRLQDCAGMGVTRGDVDRVRDDLHAVTVSDDDLTSIAAACVRLGISSMRVPVFCMHAAQALAALERRDAVAPNDITRACQLVLPGRGLLIPEAEESQASQPVQSEPETGGESETEDDGEIGETSPSLETQIVDAIASAPVQLSATHSRRSQRGRAGISGRSGAHVIALDRGRPDRSIPGQIGRGRIDVLASLRAAAPLQKVRSATANEAGLALRKSDLRIKRFKRRKQSSVIFVVDASGSAAMHRMAEAKGAVERLLSQCYSRRDLVSLISFAGDEANLVLPPSRSLVRARRQITDLAGGGATPLAHAVVEAYKLARTEQERGRTPFLVFLTDGRGNITLSGQADRAASGEETSRLARTLIKDRFPSVFFDTSRRPDPRTRRFSEDLGAQYQFLPSADGETVSQVVRQSIGSR